MTSLQAILLICVIRSLGSSPLPHQRGGHFSNPSHNSEICKEHEWRLGITHHSHKKSVDDEYTNGDLYEILKKLSNEHKTYANCSMENNRNHHGRVNKRETIPTTEVSLDELIKQISLDITPEQKKATEKSSDFSSDVGEITSDGKVTNGIQVQPGNINNVGFQSQFNFFNKPLTTSTTILTNNQTNKVIYGDNNKQFMDIQHKNPNTGFSMHRESAATHHSEIGNKFQHHNIFQTHNNGFDGAFNTNNKVPANFGSGLSNSGSFELNIGKYPANHRTPDKLTNPNRENLEADDMISTTQYKNPNLQIHGSGTITKFEFKKNSTVVQDSSHTFTRPVEYSQSSGGGTVSNFEYTGSGQASGRPKPHVFQKPETVNINSELLEDETENISPLGWLDHKNQNQGRPNFGDKYQAHRNKYTGGMRRNRRETLVLSNTMNTNKNDGQNDSIAENVASSSVKSSVSSNHRTLTIPYSRTTTTNELRKHDATNFASTSTNIKLVSDSTSTSPVVSTLPTNAKSDFNLQTNSGGSFKSESENDFSNSKIEKPKIIENSKRIEVNRGLKDIRIPSSSYTIDKTETVNTKINRKLVNGLTSMLKTTNAGSLHSHFKKGSSDVESGDKLTQDTSIKESEKSDLLDKVDFDSVDKISELKTEFIHKKSFSDNMTDRITTVNNTGSVTKPLETLVGLNSNTTSSEKFLNIGINDRKDKSVEKLNLKATILPDVTKNLRTNTVNSKSLRKEGISNERFDEPVSIEKSIMNGYSESEITSLGSEIINPAATLGSIESDIVQSSFDMVGNHAGDIENFHPTSEIDNSDNLKLDDNINNVLSFAKTLKFNPSAFSLNKKNQFSSIDYNELNSALDAGILESKTINQPSELQTNRINPTLRAEQENYAELSDDFLSNNDDKITDEEEEKSTEEDEESSSSSSSNESDETDKKKKMGAYESGEEEIDESFAKDKTKVKGNKDEKENERESLGRYESGEEEIDEKSVNDKTCQTKNCNKDEPQKNSNKAEKENEEESLGAYESGEEEIDEKSVNDKTCQTKNCNKDEPQKNSNKTEKENEEESMGAYEREEEEIDEKSVNDKTCQTKNCNKDETQENSNKAEKESEEGVETDGNVDTKDD